MGNCGAYKQKLSPKDVKQETTHGELWSEMAAKGFIKDSLWGEKRDTVVKNRSMGVRQSSEMLIKWRFYVFFLKLLSFSCIQPKWETAGHTSKNWCKKRSNNIKVMIKYEPKWPQRPSQKKQKTSSNWAAKASGGRETQKTRFAGHSYFGGFCIFLRKSKVFTR